MNINRINRWIANVPALKLQSFNNVIPIKETCEYLPELKMMDRECAKLAQVALVDLAMHLVLTDDPIVFAKIWVEFLRNDIFRRYVLATRMLQTSKPPKLQVACERMGFTDDQVYSLTAASIAVLAHARPDQLIAPILVAKIACDGKMVELAEGKQMVFDVQAKLAMMAGATEQATGMRLDAQDGELRFVEPEPKQEPESEQEPRPEPDPEPTSEPAEQPQPGVMDVQELDNRQKLVKVRSRAGNVHYIVVDENVDIERAPQIWDLINRDELRLSVNVTTDRLARSKVINDYLAEGWSPAEVAELMKVPKHIVTGDINLLRKLDRLGDTPGIRRYKRNQ